MEKKIKQVALNAAKEAGKMALDNFNGFNRSSSLMKSKREIVTKVDLASEKIIIKNIKKNFPTHQILSEESGFDKNKSQYLWIIDPIDGTTNYSMHNPLWSISIGVLKGDDLIFGIVHAPFLKESFVSIKNHGAYLGNKKLKVSKINKNKIINTYCHGSTTRDLNIAINYYAQQKRKGFDCRQLGSAAIELAYVASGRIESIVIPGAHSWDVAAGVLLVREAGGEVTDIKGNEWSLKSRDIVASNGKIHDEILKILKNVKKG